MKKPSMASIAISGALILAGAGCSSVANNIPAGSSQPAGTPTPTPTTSISGRQKFADSNFARYAYLISTDSYDAQTKSALAGFKIQQKTLPDGSRQITLSATNPEYQTQVYTVKPGQKLYFIERSWGDDSGDQEYSLRDDRAVLVDADGFIVQ